VKKIESVLKKPAPYPVPNTTKASPLKKTASKLYSNANIDIPLAAPSPDDEAKIGQLKEMANLHGQGYLKDTFTSKHRAQITLPSDAGGESAVEGPLKMPMPPGLSEPTVYIAP
jgi:hypothetical protein